MSPDDAAGMRERFATSASELVDDDPRVAVVIADISAALFAGAAARHLDRVINVGIREQLLVDVGAGLALAGMRPIVHTFASFLIERAFEQVKLGLSHQDVGGVLVSAGASYDIAAGGRTHQAPGDVALLDTLAGWTVQVPGHPDEVDPLLRSAVAGDSRSYLRLSTQANARPLVDHDAGMTVLRRGTRGTVIAVGPLADSVLAAVAGLDVTVLYAVTVRPFDTTALLATLRTPDIVLVEPYLAGTSSRCVDEALTHVPHRVLGLGVGRQELRRYGRPEEHAAAHGLDVGGIRNAIARFLG